MKNTTQLSSGDVGNAALPPLLAISSYSIVRNRSSGDKCRKADFVMHALSIFGGV